MKSLFAGVFAGMSLGYSANAEPSLIGGGHPTAHSAYARGGTTGHLNDRHISNGASAPQCAQGVTVCRVRQCGQIAFVENGSNRPPQARQGQIGPPGGG